MDLFNLSHVYRGYNYFVVFFKYLGKKKENFIIPTKDIMLQTLKKTQIEQTARKGSTTKNKEIDNTFFLIQEVWDTYFAEHMADIGLPNCTSFTELECNMRANIVRTDRTPNNSLARYILTEDYGDNNR